MDIRARDPPAEPPTDLSPEFESIWKTLEDCWSIVPSNRPTAAALLAWFEGRTAGLFLRPSDSEPTSDNAQLMDSTELCTGSPDENKQQTSGRDSVADLGLEAADSPG
jgi:hypothetical protein